MRLAQHFAISQSHIDETDCASIIPTTLRTEFTEINMLFCNLVEKGGSDTEYTLLAIADLEVSVVKKVIGLAES